MDIILYRANANKLAARVLYALLTEAGAKLSELEGGTLRNAIPREAFATVLLSESQVKAAEKAVRRVAGELKAEYAGTDPELNITFEAAAVEAGGYVEDKKALKFIQAIIACPDGVERMSDSVPGLVETSNNMAMVKIGGGKFFVKSLMRSSVDTAKNALALKYESVFKLAGIKTVFTGGYSGWAPNPKSEILALMKKTYSAMFKVEPKVMAIHAGLECGILSGAYPNWDMVSMGPTLLSPHSPDERAYIPSVQKVYDFLKAVLVEIPEKD